MASDLLWWLVPSQINWGNCLLLSAVELLYLCSGLHCTSKWIFTVVAVLPQLANSSVLFKVLWNGTLSDSVALKDRVKHQFERLRYIHAWSLDIIAAYLKALFMLQMRESPLKGHWSNLSHHRCCLIPLFSIFTSAFQYLNYFAKVFEAYCARAICICYLLCNTWPGEVAKIKDSICYDSHNLRGPKALCKWLNILNSFAAVND